MTVYKEEATRLIAEVQRVLWEVWDPIGVNDTPGAFGEYDSYAPSIAGKLLRGATEEEIADCLNRVATDRMGLNHRRALDKPAARALVGLVRHGETE